MITADRRPTERPRIVVFDIGNVLIAWDPRYLYRTVFPGRPAAMEWFLGHVCTDAWNLAQDGGRRWRDGVGALVVERPEWRAEIEAFDRHWQTMVPGTIDGTVAILGELRRANIPLYAITNFSTEKFAESMDRFPFFGWFDGIVVSGDEGLLKPDERIFALLCARYDLQPSACFFIDDNAANVAGALAAGLTAHRFTTPEALRDDLVAHGFPVSG